MKIPAIVVLSLSVLVSTQALALNLFQKKEPVAEQPYGTRSCNELYIEVSALEKQSFSYETDKGERTQMASAVSTIFTPALYLVGYSAIQDYRTGVQAKSTFAKIEEVRYQMAEKRCFEK